MEIHENTSDIEDENRNINIGYLYTNPLYNYRVLFDPAGDGNCQFSAVAHQLSHRLGIYTSPEVLRNQVVSFIESNEAIFRPFIHDGVNNSVVQWDNYLRNMQRVSTFGDHLTLLAVSHLYQVQFVILSNQGYNNVLHVSFLNDFDESLPSLTLLHQSEEQGIHYQSIEVKDLSQCCFDLSHREIFKSINETFEVPSNLPDNLKTFYGDYSSLSNYLSYSDMKNAVDNALLDDIQKKFLKSIKRYRLSQLKDHVD